MAQNDRKVRMNMKRVLTVLLVALLLVGTFVSCGSKGELKKGKIVKNTEAEEQDSGNNTLTTSKRAELDAIYQQKLAGTQAFAEVPRATGNGKTYYVSSINGNDNNNGLSSATAWKTPKKTNNIVKSGDVVLFECGSVFRRSNEYFLTMKSGVTYATYGTGAKPIFYGSIDASDAGKWVQVKTNVYKYTEEILLNGGTNDIGAIVFNGGEAWGIKIQMTYNSNRDAAYQTLALSGVDNGLQSNLNVQSYSLTTGADLQGPDLSFYHDARNVYLYCEGGNPGRRFSSIELSQSNCAFYGNGISDVTVLNLDFRNFGEHGISAYDCKNLTVKNCEFRFIGGTIQVGFGDWRNYDTRLGNAIQNWNSCDGMTIENCFFDQTYDTAMTTQSNSNVSTKNVTYRNNVSQNMWFGVELWAGDPKNPATLEFSNVDVSGNYFKNIGEGFTTQRPDKKEDGYSINAFIKVSRGPYQTNNSFSVTDNIIDGTNGKMLYCNQAKTNSNTNGVLLDRNTYIGSENVDFAVISGKKYAYKPNGISDVQALGVETNGTFYFVQSADPTAMLSYTYQAKNKVELPLRVFFPTGYDSGESYPLVVFFNAEQASGTDNLANITKNSSIISKLIREDRAIVVVPQCPSGTWTGLKVSNGNYSTETVAETDVMKAVAAMIRDVAEEFDTIGKYAIGIDAGAYAVSDLLVRHQNLLVAGIVIAGAGDPSASIGGAEAWIIHSKRDDEIPFDDASELAEAWDAKTVFYDNWSILHDCWDEASKKEDLLGWLLSK